MNHKFKVDIEKCTKCGLCVNDCLTKAIEINENGNPEMKSPSFCIKCQHCFAICPNGAISIMNKNPENSEKIEKYDSENLLNLIKSRRSKSVRRARAWFRGPAVRREYSDCRHH